MARRSTALAVALLMATALAAAQTTRQHADSNEAAKQVSPADRQFLQLAIDNGAKEVQLSERAREKTQRADVQQFAQHMVDDHSATNRQLMELNKALLGEQGPPFKKASAQVKRETDELKALQGEAFDERYMQIMIKDHQTALELYQQQAQHGHNPEIKALAQSTVPTLERHLHAAQEISEKKAAP